MIIYCQQKNTDAAYRYTLEFILNTLGYFFRWIDDEDIDLSDGLLLHSDPATASQNKAELFIPFEYELDKLHKNKITWQTFNYENTILPVLPVKNTENSEIPFDLISTVYFHLSRVEENQFQHPDDVDASVEKSLLWKYGQFLVPVVDLLMQWLDKLIQRKYTVKQLPWIKKAPFPRSEPMGIALTHDVDITRAYNPLQHLWYALQGARKRNEIQHTQAEIWAFDELLPLYQKLDWKASFNFIPRFTEGMHFRYRIAAKKFRKLIRELIYLGHEIGFHPSRFAFDKPKRYQSELKRLAGIAQSTILGLRHHYLRCNFPQIWRVVEKLGLKYDSTLAYRRHTGFRAGTTKPFQCFDHEHQLPIDCMEFSTAFFEESLSGMGTDVAHSKQVIKQCFKTAEKYQGLLTILWHPSNMFRPQHFKEIWNYILSLIKNQKAFLAPLSDQYAWQAFRNGISISQQKIENKVHIIQLDHSGTDSTFSLTLPADYKIMTATGGTAEFRSDTNSWLIHSNRVDKLELKISTQKVDR